MSNHQTIVKAIMPTDVRDDQSLPQPCVILSCNVHRCYIQSQVGGAPDSPRRIFDEGSSSYQAEHPSAPFASPDHLLSSQTLCAIVSSMLDNMRLPFPLDRLRLLDGSAGTNATEKRLTRDELVSMIARATSHAVNDPCNEGRNRTKMVVSMVHKVTVSEREINEMRSQRRRLMLQNRYSRMLEEEERGRLVPLREWHLLLYRMSDAGLVANFDHDMEDVRRRMELRESMDQERINFQAASESTIESLNKVVFEGDQGSSSHELNCVVCMEEVAIGDQLVRMDCCHEFHKGCIEAWLRVQYTCPLCRYKLAL